MMRGVGRSTGAPMTKVNHSDQRLETLQKNTCEYFWSQTNPANGLIAHLNILSLHSGTYVDPEDWSSNRTQYFHNIPAGGSRTTTWRLQAVNGGEFGVYVAVLPETGAGRPPQTTPTIHLAVAERKTLNSGGILPLTLGIPALLGIFTLGLRRRRGGSS